jgi:hypothetical protein
MSKGNEQTFLQSKGYEMTDGINLGSTLCELEGTILCIDDWAMTCDGNCGYSR